ncbi:hypothetical protein AL073_08780 [Loktanella sp. 1ANDIMAR09]|nr:hypothetical protein AL073_08780 [Loktanella sp. 1ANDIMAR09]
MNPAARNISQHFGNVIYFQDETQPCVRGNTTYVAGGILAALLIAAAVGQEDAHWQRPLCGNSQL